MRYKTIALEKGKYGVIKTSLKKKKICVKGTVFLNSGDDVGWAGAKALGTDARAGLGPRYSPACFR